MNESILDRIMNSQLNKGDKIIKLWLVAMLNYRQPLGNKAFDKIQELTDREILDALLFLGGLSMGMQSQIIIEKGPPKLADRFEDILNEEGDW